MKLNTEYHNNGNKSSEGYTHDDTDWEIGTLTFWHENGNKDQVQNYKDDGSGEQDGMFTAYKSNEEIDFQMIMKDGKNYEGRWIWYDEKRNRTKMEVWEGGKLLSNKLVDDESLITYYDEDANIRQEQNFKNGKLDGKLNSYLNDGQLDWSMEYRSNNFYTGVWIRRYPNGQIDIKEIWKDGKLIKRELGLPKLIINILKEKAVKMPASDIDAFLRFQDVDLIKKQCEKLYHSGQISRTSNYRYFVLLEEKTKTQKPKENKADPTVEIRKYGKLKDDGLITEEEYQAKKKELLGL